MHVPISRRFEGAAALSFLSIDPEVGEGRSGMTDVLLHGKYHLPGRRAQFAVGGSLTLPVGDEDIGSGDDIDIGFSARYGTT